MKIAFIGCVEFSYFALSSLYKLDYIEVVCVVTRKQSNFNSDFKDLSELATEHKTPTFIAQESDQKQMAGFISEFRPDVVYCLGWSYLLGVDVLNIAPLGVIGFHPAKLPSNRGRHPLIWALALGLKETASTFFFMDEGADTGDILSQELVEIEDADDAASLYKKVSEVALVQINRFTKDLSCGAVKRVSQRKDAGNTWRKRNIRDGEIDWRMSAIAIHNLVRALTKPYVGAHCLVGGKLALVWQTEIFSERLPENIEPGKVLKIQGKSILVKCAGGGVWLHNHELDNLVKVGDYL